MTLGDARWIRRAVHPGGLPVQLTFFVTSRCNAKCSHCFYGEQLNQPAERELTLPEIARVARGLPRMLWVAFGGGEPFLRRDLAERSEEHTSELQSPCNLVCRLLLEKKNISTS